jgi:hypothetical protein
MSNIQKRQAMTNLAVQDLIAQYQHTFRILIEEIERFTPDDWRKGISAFQSPVVQAMHLLDCLDFYSVEDDPASQPYHWGHRFGGGWWALPAEYLPDQATVLAYARELQARILAQLAILSDQDLLCVRNVPDAPADQRTVLGHHVYALKHTLHHHGQLAALSVLHGHAGGSWD